jgi:hypothetical protein
MNDVEVVDFRSLALLVNVLVTAQARVRAHSNCTRRPGMMRIGDLGRELEHSDAEESELETWSCPQIST